MDVRSIINYVGTCKVNMLDENPYVGSHLSIEAAREYKNESKYKYMGRMLAVLIGRKCFTTVSGFWKSVSGVFYCF